MAFLEMYEQYMDLSKDVPSIHFCVELRHFCFLFSSFYRCSESVSDRVLDVALCTVTCKHIIIVISFSLLLIIFIIDIISSITISKITAATILSTSIIVIIILSLLGMVLREVGSAVTEDQDRLLRVDQKFSSFTAWNLDKPPSADDKLMKALQWIEVAKAVSVQTAAFVITPLIMIYEIWDHRKWNLKF